MIARIAAEAAYPLSVGHMKRIAAFILALGCDAIGQAQALDEISQQQADMLSAVLEGREDSKAISAIPRLKGGVLDPILFTTGVHCVLPSDGESLHSVQFMVAAGAKSHRQVFTFTVSPPAPFGEFDTFASLLANRRITQFHIWSSPDENVAYHSRSSLETCERHG